MKTKLMALEALIDLLNNSHEYLTMQGRISKAKAAIAALEADIANGGDPVSAESKFTTSREWSRCTIEHHEMVQRSPDEWRGYETRLLYTTPQEPAAAELLCELKAHQQALSMLLDALEIDAESTCFNFKAGDGSLVAKITFAELQARSAAAIAKATGAPSCP